MSKVILFCGAMMAGKTILARHLHAGMVIEVGAQRLPAVKLRKFLAANNDNLAVITCEPAYIRSIILKLEALPTTVELMLWGLQPLMLRNRNGQTVYGKYSVPLAPNWNAAGSTNLLNLHRP